MKKAVFLDRDGVLNEDIDLLYKKEDVKILKSTKNALKKIKENGFYLVVITNQPVIARGLIDEKGVEEINEYINSRLDNLIDRFYFCPHHPNANLENYRKVCECRKPSSGMILKAKEDLNINLKNSWMIGDRISDIVCGKNAGCETILIKSKNNFKNIESGKIFRKANPNYFFENLYDAAKFITNSEK